jgi:hypothetical protein
MPSACAAISRRAGTMAGAALMRLVLLMIWLEQTSLQRSIHFDQATATQPPPRCLAHW